jgi:hypothetical protein
MSAFVATLRAAWRARYAQGFGRLDALRIALLAGGVLAGVTGVSALLCLGESFGRVFDDLERAVTRAPALRVEAVDGALTESLLAEVQAGVNAVALVPVIEREGTLSRTGSLPLTVLALDLLGDARIPLPPVVLDESTITELVTPRVWITDRLRERARIHTDEALELTVGDRSAYFLVAATPLPETFVARHGGAVVVVDIGHFLSEYGAVAGMDRWVGAGVEARLIEAHEELVAALPPSARVVMEGDEAMLSRAWITTWRSGTVVVVSVGVLLGVVLVFLSVVATFGRMAPEASRLLRAGHAWTGVFVADAMEVGFLTLAGAAVGMVQGPLLASLVVHLGFRVSPWGPVAPVGLGSPPILPVLGVVVMGFSVATVWACLQRAQGAEDEPRPTLRVSMAPAAVAGILLSVASLFLVPGFGPNPLVRGYASAFLAVMALALLGRPVLVAGARLLGRLIGSRFPILWRVISTQVHERTTALSVAMGFLVFTFATVAAAWTVTTELRAQHQDWLWSRFGEDVVIDPLPREGGGEAVIQPSLVTDLAALPEVGAVITTHAVRSTLNGATLDLEVVSPALVARLGRVRSGDPPPLGPNEVIDPIWLTRDQAVDFGLRPGDPVRLDTPSGSWPVYLAGTYVPRPGERSVAIADASRSGERLAANASLARVAVRFVPGMEPDRGRDAVSRALGTSRVRLQAPGDLRPDLDRAAFLAYRALGLLTGILGCVAAAAVLAVGPGIVFDSPRSWITLVALGVSRPRLAGAAVVGLGAATAVGLLVGGAVGVFSGSALTGALAEPAVRAIPGTGAIFLLVLAGLAFWLATCLAALAALRFGFVARELGGGVEP